MILLNKLRVEGRLESLTLSVQSGQSVHLVGANGAGKSSLLAVLAGLLEVDSGEYRLSHQPIDELAPRTLAHYRAFLEQDYHCAFPLTVFELLDYFGSGRPVPEALVSALEIEGFYGRPLTELSGGEQQRVQLARVLLQVWPKIEQGQALVLLDEPLAGLDYRHQHQLLALLRTLTHKGNLVVMSSHDLTMSFEYADRLLLLKEKHLLANERTDDLRESSLLGETLDCQVRWLYDQSGHCAVQTSPA